MHEVDIRTPSGDFKFVISPSTIGSECAINLKSARGLPLSRDTTNSDLTCTWDVWVPRLVYSKAVLNVWITHSPYCFSPMDLEPRLWFTSRGMLFDKFTSGPCSGGVWFALNFSVIGAWCFSHRFVWCGLFAFLLRYRHQYFVKKSRLYERYSPKFVSNLPRAPCLAFHDMRPLGPE